MAEHRLLVPIFDGSDLMPMDTIREYDGPPNWKWEPVDEKARAAWAESVADPDRVKEARRVARGGFPEPLEGTSEPDPRQIWDNVVRRASPPPRNRYSEI